MFDHDAEPTTGGDSDEDDTTIETAPRTGGRRARAVSPGEDAFSLAQQERSGQRVMAFIDGFNLYNGIKAKFGHRYLWLDVQCLARAMTHPWQVLAGVVYCTARVREESGRQHRQEAYLWALAEHCDVLEILEGSFKVRHRRCRDCRTTWVAYEEKETDVNLATALVEHAAVGAYDVGLIVSADSDLCPAVRAVKRIRPEIRVVACFPPRRSSEDLRRAVDASLVVGEGRLRQSQLPDQVPTRTGVVLERPKKWR